MQSSKEFLISCSHKFNDAMKDSNRRVVICAGTGCVANGSLEFFHALENKIKEAGLNVKVLLNYEDNKSEPKDSSFSSDIDLLRLSKSGCQGFCQMGPLLSIEPDKILYTKVKLEDINEIIETTIKNKKIIERLLYVDRHNNNQRCKGQHEIPFYQRQTRLTLKPCGVFEPEDIYEYIANCGYDAARIAWTDMTPESVCGTIAESGLRGRGGGGFPTGKKWQFALKEKNQVKYVICNADEGDPGAFMDRSVMEGNPHSVIEGMMIAARGIEATAGYVYVRLEYPLAVQRIRRAVEDAEKLGILGDNVFNTGKPFRIHVMEGAGAFVCGEETALIASIEGGRGMPRPKPPFPAQSGLWGKPTVINNVETLAAVPYIILNGAKSYRDVGTENSPGTKTFALTGHVVNTGLIEVPFGTTLREIIFDIGGGVIDKNGNISNDNFKAVQIGGPSGGCLTEEHLDLPLDFDSLRGVGAMVGSGGLVVMNKGTCMVQMARFFMQFTQNESCGKCLLCRDGTRQMLVLLDDIISGNGTQETLDVLGQVARTVSKGSLCALGKTAPNPVLSTIRNFREELYSHVFQKRCPAAQCKALARPEIIAEKCKGCTACSKKCPIGAISGERKSPHVIDAEKCIKCGECVRTCKFNAIIGV
ncbi:MAG: 4Fe-4S binding protein [Planctomycetaceae bacterium]|jgi:NADH-quinone oxidoreductase subunit F|nr:4Fe-4S binding protein [Planctomycetaceae bacterium]